MNIYFCLANMHFEKPRKDLPVFWDKSCQNTKQVFQHIPRAII